MAKLSAAQVRALKHFHADHRGFGFVAEATFVKIQSLGLVRRRRDPVSGYTMGGWELTDAGRAALAEAEREKTDE